MTDRVHKVRAVQGVEMEFAHAFVDQVEHLLRGDGRRDQLSRRRIVVQSFEAAREPLRH